MKQVIIAHDGYTVETVNMVPDDFQGDLVLPDDAYVGPGMIWDQSADQPLFTYQDNLAEQTATVWSKVKAFFGLT